MQLPISISLDKVENNLLLQKGITLEIARLDLIHPVVSGNKLFKLHYFLKNAVSSSSKTVLSFGGPYSNHLVATAYACQSEGIRAVGMIRGEKPTILNDTLQDCLQYGMELEFISRDQYRKFATTDSYLPWKEKFGNYLMIPEGGYHPLGAQGAALIPGFWGNRSPTHVVTSCGTCTTIAGVAKALPQHVKILGISALKGMTDYKERFRYLLQTEIPSSISFFNEAHVGGYAKFDQELIDFMNALYHTAGIPTDFVYTGKMLQATFKMIQDGVIPEGSKIICIHSGGLQGNRSLPQGILDF